MHTPEARNVFYMEMFDHAGPDSLDAIATRVYGRPYMGQQTGDMISNDTHVYYDMSEGEVAQWNYDIEQMKAEDGKGLYLGLKPVTPGTGEWGGNHAAMYAEGVDWFEYWLALKVDPNGPWEGPRGWQDAREFTFRDEQMVARHAPTPQYVLADLIQRGELPYGQYILHVSW